MDAVISIARQARAQHRHELRTLTYLTVDHANGGIVRNLNQNGMGAQMVAALRPGQQVRVRFEMRDPRLRVETRGEVVWGTFSGQCGLRFLDLPQGMRRQINEWIFGNLLDGISLHAERPGSIFAGTAFDHAGAETVSAEYPLRHGVEEEDGLLISRAAPKVIALVRREVAQHETDEVEELETHGAGSLDWLSQPLSPRGIASAIDILAVLAAFLLFALVFLSVSRETPPWPLAFTAGAVVVVAGLYWGFFWVFGGKSLGTRLARRVGSVEEDEAGIEAD